MVRSQACCTRFWGKLFPKNGHVNRGYVLVECSGAFGPAGGGWGRERLPLVVSRTVGSARGADPIMMRKLKNIMAKAVKYFTI